MAAEPAKRLGRGLDALLGTLPTQDGGDRAGGRAGAEAGRRSVPIEQIERNPRNPRRDFAADDLADLAASLKQHGIVQPIVVRRLQGEQDRFEIIAGERRWRAAQLAGLHDVPVTIIDVTDRQALELAIVENVQRADLNPVEEARGYQALMEEFGYTQADLGETIGKSRVHVTNTLRLLKLPPGVLAMLQDGRLTAGHGRALLAAPRPEVLAKQIAEKSLSVREAERLAQRSESTPVQRSRAQKSADIAALERELGDILGLRVELRHQAEGRGEIRIAYRKLEQLEDVCRKLRR